MSYFIITKSVIALDLQARKAITIMIWNWKMDLEAFLPFSSLRPCLCLLNIKDIALNSQDLSWASL